MIAIDLRPDSSPYGLKETLPPLAPGSYVVLSVRDNGSGMSDETKKRLFELYFTTKEVGKGTGLGLSIVQSLLNNMHGGIKVESELGKGSQFLVYFPEIPANIK